MISSLIQKQQQQHTITTAYIAAVATFLNAVFSETEAL